MKSYLLSPDKLLTFVKELSRDGSLFFPALEDGKTHLVRFDENGPFQPDFTKIRTAENIKQFFFPIRGTVAKFPKDEASPVEKRYLLGIKNCDLRGIDVYDRVFMGWDPVDPFYKARRDKTIVISADCPEPEDSCFCNLLGINPFGDAVSDLNFTEISTGLLFEAFTKRGEEIIAAYPNLFVEAKEADEKDRKAIREKAAKKLNSINSKPFKKDLPDRIAGANKERMRDARGECVECHACLHGCPTCYCFLLSDYKKGKEIERVRLWDACYYAAYARVGGGANPRSRIDERFWNRFQCKFDFFSKYEDIYACSGCGRCLLGCSSKIDIREILWNL
jgi:sulfhydrogenase subunit beta (sulfur reductase)